LKLKIFDALLIRASDLAVLFGLILSLPDNQQISEDIGMLVHKTIAIVDDLLCMAKSLNHLDHLPSDHKRCVAGKRLTIIAS
jgi:hypothetical protein